MTRAYLQIHRRDSFRADVCCPFCLGMHAARKYVPTVSINSRDVRASCQLLDVGVLQEPVRDIQTGGGRGRARQGNPSMTSHTTTLCLLQLIAAQTHHAVCTKVQELLPDRALFSWLTAMCANTGDVQVGSVHSGAAGGGDAHHRLPGAGGAPCRRAGAAHVVRLSGTPRSACGVVTCDD